MKTTGHEYGCMCMEELPKGHTRGRDWSMHENRPYAAQRDEYAQADKATDKQINETGLVSRSAL
jgi:hypothetical protein